MGILLRPSTSEVRTLLHKIKMENMERGLSLNSVGTEKQKFELLPNRKLGDEFRQKTGSELDRNRNKTFQRPQTDDFNIRFRGFEDNLEVLLNQCKKELAGLPPPLPRKWRISPDFYQEISAMFGNSMPSENEVETETIRIFQWNVLSQTLGTQCDNLTRCPWTALDWKTRRFRMLEEIVQHNPDIICLQEVDNFEFLRKSLSSLGYIGHFQPKPDSPCLHFEDNTGPDGCLIFYKYEKFELKKLDSKVLEVWGVQSNQVALTALLRSRFSGSEFVVSTTHLKARKGPLMASLRNEQGKDLIEHLAKFSSGKPVICTGDFNAEPNEPVYATMTQPEDLGLSSAYATSYGGEEVDYTSWKIRGDEEHKDVLDYIFYSQNDFEVKAVLEPVAENEVGRDRFPNLAFASDHMSLVTDLKILAPQKNNTF